MLSEGSSVKGSPEDKQASAPYIRGSAKISRRVTLARFTGILPEKLLGTFSIYHVNDVPGAALDSLAPIPLWWRRSDL